MNVLLPGARISVRIELPVSYGGDLGGARGKATDQLIRLKREDVFFDNATIVALGWPLLLPFLSFVST